jgi:hypothetical protein
MKFLCIFIFGLFCGLALAQDITADELIQLDKLRDQFKSRGVEMSAEQEARILKTIRAFKNLPGSNSQSGAVSSPNAGAMPSMSAIPASVAIEKINTPIPTTVGVMKEDELLLQIQNLPAAQPTWTAELLPDGLQYEGKRFVDEHGRSENFAIDAASGSVGYLVKLSVTTYAVKIARLNGAAPIQIGQLQKMGNSLQFDTVTGRKLSGELFFPLTTGALVLRDSVGFLYTAGKGVQQIQIPKGWSPAPLQRGNIAATGWLLLEKDKVDEKANPLAGIMGSLTRISSIVTGATSEGSGDYALMELGTGKLKLFDVSSADKNVMSYSQCRRKNAAVNICDSMTSYESVWSRDGSPNNGHYYWKINWQSAQNHPIAVVMENGFRRINAYDLTSDVKVNMFERALGIASVKVALQNDGRLRVVAQMGFSPEAVDDVWLALANKK